MVKISIALPNQTEIRLEAEDPDQLRPVVEMVRRQLLIELASLTTPANGGAVVVAENDKSTWEEITDPPSPPKRNVPVRADVQPPHSKASEEPIGEPAGESILDPSSANSIAVPPGLSDPRRARDFTIFCRGADPMGDMRKVIAAAEGARRHLNMDNVDTWELGHLFDLAGWTRPRNFTQTLRNAARTSFRWLERVPGRAGRYTTTEKGRSEVLGDTPPT